jgi:MFS family permease
VNIFELGLVLAIITVGYFCGKWLGFHCGVVGWILGFLVAIILGGAGLVIMRKLLVLWHKWRPFRPPCKNGKCSNDDYEFVEFSEDGVILRCRCGLKYSHKGRYFMEILDDGSTRPYMKRHGCLRGWKLNS